MEWWLRISKCMYLKKKKKTSRNRIKWHPQQMKCVLNIISLFIRFARCIRMLFLEKKKKRCWYSIFWCIMHVRYGTVPYRTVPWVDWYSMHRYILKFPGTSEHLQLKTSFENWKHLWTKVTRNGWQDWRDLMIFTFPFRFFFFFTSIHFVIQNDIIEE